MKKEEALLQEELRKGNRMVFEALYTDHRVAFINYGKGFELVEDVLLDIYQDATIALFQNFVTKQVVLETSSVKTYLFGIGKFMILTHLKKTKHVYLDKLEQREYDQIEIETPEETLESKQLAKGFKLLGEKCKELLRLYYYRSLTIKEIVEHSQYKDENTVKSYKSRCMRQLRELIKNKES